MTPVSPNDDRIPTPDGHPVRTETDSLGSMDVPADAYWGIHTARALENFPISLRPLSVYPEFVVALAQVKQAAARANVQIGVLDARKAKQIDEVCTEIIAGQLHDQFVVGVIQGGAGTSTNMNTNEVIANRALERAGHALGDYRHMHPLDDVNRSQSTNDTYPTALKVALIHSLLQTLDELDLLRRSFLAKGAQFSQVLKVGRTQLQDAVPMTLGQEFHGFATTLGEDHARLGELVPLLSEINLGATAIGTGITADPNYAAAVRGHLSAITGYTLVTASDLIEATSDAGVFMTLSSTLKRSAIKLSKICNDLRLLSSGPQAGLGRDQPAAAPGGIEHHARQGQPGDPRGRQPGRVLHRGCRRDGDHGGRGRAAAAQRVRARHRALAAAVAELAAERGQDAARELHRRDHGEH